MSFTQKFINHNLYHLKGNKKKSNKIFLVEFNGWPAIHIIFFYLINFFKNEKGCKIVAYECYHLLNRLEPAWYSKYLWKLGIFLNIKTFKIFKSFGTDQFIKPTYAKNYDHEADRIIKNFYLKKPNLVKLENFKLKKIWIGDLIYDSFLKKNYLVTIDINSNDFKIFFKKSIKLFLFWKNYFNTNKISGIGVCHSVYLTGIPLRIAQSKKIDCFAISGFNCDLVNLVNSISYKNKTNGTDTHYKYYNKIFSKFPKKIKNEHLILGKKILDDFTSGRKKYFYMKNKTFSLSKSKKIKEKKSKTKVVIFAHDFVDSPHVYGNHFFTDFKSWFNFLDKIIKNTDYNWYVKVHPGANEITKKEILKLKKDNKKIKLLEKNFPNNHLVKMGVKFVLTVFGTIASELPPYGIRVINASKNTPHYDYNFSLNPKNLKEYKNLLLNLNNVNGEFKFDNKELFMYQFVKELIFQNHLFFKDTERYFKFTDKRPLHLTPQIYKYWLEDFNLEVHNKIINDLREFIYSKNYLTLNQNINTFRT